jgi:hypothetical protein
MIVNMPSEEELAVAQKHPRAVEQGQSDNRIEKNESNPSFQVVQVSVSWCSPVASG